MKRALSWVFVIVAFGFALMINTSYIETGGTFIDFTKWQQLTFWVQIGVNTLVLTQLYATRLRKRKADIIKDSEHIQGLYEQLFAEKDKIINGNKKERLNVYLNIHTNLVDKLELYIYKLEKRLRRAITRTAKKRIAEQHEKYENYLSAVKLLDYEVIKKSDVDPHSVSVKTKKISYDTLFDLVDYKSSKPISISYSDTRETNKKIAKSPLSSFFTMFTAIVAFGNILVWGDDWRSMLLISLTLAFSSIMKISKADDDANEIATNKSRSLEKAVDTVKMFSLLTIADLDKMNSILTDEKKKAAETAKTAEEKTEVYNKDTNTYDFPKLSRVS